MMLTNLPFTDGTIFSKENSSKETQPSFDHLLFVLLRQVIPFFIAKHSRSRPWFEGLDLEMMRYKKIEATACTVRLNPFNS